MKKILSVFLSLSMLISAGASASAATVDGLIYKDSSGEKTVDMYPGEMTVEANVTGESGDSTAWLISSLFKGNRFIGAGTSQEKNIASGTQKLSATFNVDTTDGVNVENYIWNDKTNIQPIADIKTVLIDLEVTEKKGYQVLNWASTADASGHTFTVLKDGAVLAENLPESKHAYVDKTQGSGASSYQVKAIKSGKEVGASNIVSSTPIAITPVADPSTVSGKQTWTLDPTSITTANGYAYTNDQLKAVADASSWTIGKQGKWYNSSGSGSLVDKTLDDNVFMIGDGNARKFIVVFGDEIKAYDTVDVSFDLWGTQRWQNGYIRYGDANNTLQNGQVGVKWDHWEPYSFNNVSTSFELTNYGRPGEYGFVIDYPSNTATEEYKLWVKDIEVSKDLGTEVSITANSTGAGYSEMLPSGPELTTMNVNALSGALLTKSTYGAGYAYRNVNGEDAFYLTQLYNTTNSTPIDVNRGYLDFKVDSDKFPKNPNSVSGLYLITEYYDGTVGDITTTPFKISYTTNRYGWDNTAAVNPVAMTGSNEWKTNVVQLTGNLFLGTDLPNGFDSASISYSIPTANDGYNKKGILIRKVILCDETYKNYYTSAAYTSAAAAYENYVAQQKKLEAVDKFPNGVELDFNKAGANSTPDTDYWSDIETNGIALRCDSINDNTDNSLRGIQYGQYGPANDKRWAVSTASYWGARASSGRMSYMYFKVDESYINADPQDVEIEITYYDYADGNFTVPNRIEVLNKNATSGSSKESTYKSQTNTDTWKTATIRLSDAVFDKSDEGYGDFRLTLETSSTDVKQLIISDIKVRNITAKTQDTRESGASPTVYIAADSIAANYNTAEYGYRAEYDNRYGWGEKLNFGAVTVADRAVAGQSTKNFNFEGVYDRLKKGDYVLISFGHNDSDSSKSATYVTVDEYKANLKKVVNTVLSKGATPVLISSIPTYDPDNYAVNTNDAIDPYREAALEVASDCGILGIDLYSAFKAKLESLPDETAKSYYQNENDAGWHKRIHLTEAGAECVAGLITDALKDSSKIIGLKNYIN